MAAREPQQLTEEELACPTCKAHLKKRRTRKPDVCEMICGGCGEIFDVRSGNRRQITQFSSLVGARHAVPFDIE